MIPFWGIETQPHEGGHVFSLYYRQISLFIWSFNSGLLKIIVILQESATWAFAQLSVSCNTTRYGWNKLSNYHLCTTQNEWKSNDINMCKYVYIQLYSTTVYCTVLDVKQNMCTDTWGLSRCSSFKILLHLENVWTGFRGEAFFLGEAEFNLMNRRRRGCKTIGQCVIIEVLGMRGSNVTL